MKDLLVKFLMEVDRDFPTSLSEKVNIQDYATKLADNAIISAIFEDNQIVGMSAVYCNNKENGYAYIPLVAVHPKMRGKKLSKTLIQSVISIATERKFRKIGIHTENPIAQKLYESYGFHVIEDGDRKYLEIIL